MQVSRPLSLPPSARDNLYHGLPITVKSALRSRLQTYNPEEEVCLLAQHNIPKLKCFISSMRFGMHSMTCFLKLNFQSGIQGPDLTANFGASFLAR
jgi:hypothetical protein